MNPTETTLSICFLPQNAAPRTLEVSQMKRGARPTKAIRKTPALDGVETLPGVRSKVAEGFVWVWGATYPHRAMLAAKGYRWNNGRQAWCRPADNDAPRPAGPDRPAQVRTLGSYEGVLRNLAREVKSGGLAAIEESARRLAPLLPRRAVIVPMPSRHGYPTTIRALADAIAALAPDAEVLDALRSNPHEANYTQKKRGQKPARISMRAIRTPPTDRPTVILDNVIDTGATASAALEALPGAALLALANTTNTPARLLPDLDVEATAALPLFEK